MWRAAKGAATRYLSPAAGSEVSAREVATRYLAALAETSGRGDRLAAFRFTRKAAQDLGAFWEEVNSRGWEATLAEHGLTPLTQEPPEMLTPGLTALVAGRGGGLEEAVVQTAVALVVRSALFSAARPDPALVVRRFLATAVRLRLVLDLGEPLEAAAGGYERLRAGLDRLQAVLEAETAGAAAPSAPPAAPEHWRGLPGWNWITEIMTGLLQNLEG